MSRLQVGGLAMIISDIVCHENDGKLVKIIAYHESVECRDPTGTHIAHGIWEVACDSGIIIWDGSVKYYGDVGYEGKYLLPLGDDEGIELYNLKEELKEAY
ncbi:hypothetical protein I6L25_12970 [Acinetobacter nosocomialis]|uniref:hypothetical protein n=1 Tax=Acinetobacter nosocomialis TaxID=106654 RepID=UPI0002D0D55B|nr:hypothetical protein [Acinetobacter nosocomialis]ENU46301.1 hypothetical protein F984_02340 [Acinetobacter nosocomialis NIPH 2119]QXC11308.1 hypothetical protein I6L25_12970 [Acinetobacter nosocomialis]